MEITVVGIGAMASAMVPQLVRGGYTVRAWNRRPVADLDGVEFVASPELCFDSDVVVTMLANDQAVREVILDSKSLSSARRGCVHVMMATISPSLAQELVIHHREAGVSYVAAPVFGIPSVAARGQLNILAAGEGRALEIVQPLFDLLGQRTWPLGDDPVRANVAKIAGNLMIAQAIEAMGEAAALVEAYGLPAGDFLEVVTNTMFDSPSYRRYAGLIVSGKHEPGFKLALGLKDVQLAIDAAQSKRVSLPAAEVVQKHMQMAIDRGLGDKDWSIAAQVLRGPATRQQQEN